MPSWEQITEALTRDVLNPSAVGNPDETPILFVGADLRALLNPCQCGGVNGFHSDDCLIGDRLAAVERERDEARADAESHRQGADAWYRRAMSARARIAAVEALHFTRGRNILGKPVCAECSPLQPMPCPTLRALAASPTPTGPEPHEHERDPVFDLCDCEVPGPVTPEPTEETP